MQDTERLNYPRNKVGAPAPVGRCSVRCRLEHKVLTLNLTTLAILLRRWPLTTGIHEPVGLEPSASRSQRCAVGKRRNP
jgi:hypothetical protein